MREYNELVKRVFNNSQFRMDRTNIGTWSVFGESLKLDLSIGFPIITQRRINYKAAIGELAAFLNGATTNKEFKDFGCNYWSDYGENLGPIYGAQWRNFNGVNQLEKLINGILADPYSRRHILSTWNPADLHKMTLPPCHLTAQFYVSPGNYLDCMVHMRSVDVMLGLPYDIIVYALLTHLVAQDTGYSVGDLIFTFGDTHIYNNHMQFIEGYLTKPLHRISKLRLSKHASVFNFDPCMTEIIDYSSNIPMEFKLNV